MESICLHERSLSDPGTNTNSQLQAFRASHKRKSLCGKSSFVITTRVPKFLRCLYEMLHYEDQSILSWSKDGQCFKIFDQARLEQTVLPTYFKHGKFASFQRQLNNFGFRKWTKTQSQICTFSHSYFVAREPHQLVDLLVHMRQLNDHQELCKQYQHEMQRCGLDEQKHMSKRQRVICSNQDTDNNLRLSSWWLSDSSPIEQSYFPRLLLHNPESISGMQMNDILSLDFIKKTSQKLPTNCYHESGVDSPVTHCGLIEQQSCEFTPEELDDIFANTLPATEPAFDSVLFNGEI